MIIIFRFSMLWNMSIMREADDVKEYFEVPE